MFYIFLFFFLFLFFIHEAFIILFSLLLVCSSSIMVWKDQNSVRFTVLITSCLTFYFFPQFPCFFLKSNFCDLKTHCYFEHKSAGHEFSQLLLSGTAFLSSSVSGRFSCVRMLGCWLLLQHFRRGHCFLFQLPSFLFLLFLESDTASTPPLAFLKTF